jgi:hypothetical protein
MTHKGRKDTGKRSVRPEHTLSSLVKAVITNSMELSTIREIPIVRNSIVSQQFMEPKGSIPNSQELSACPYPEPDQSSPHHPIPPLQDPS